MMYFIDGTGDESSSDYGHDMGRGFCWQMAVQNGYVDNYFRGPTGDGLETWKIGDKVVEKIKSNPAKQSPLILVGHSRGAAAAMYVARKLKDTTTVDALILFDAVRRAPTPSEIKNIESKIWPAKKLAIIQAIKKQADSDKSTPPYGEDDRISPNVQHCLHFVRDEAFSNYFINTQEFKSLADKTLDKAASATNDISPVGLDSDSRRILTMFEFHRRMRDACRFDCIKFGISTGFSFGNTGLVADPPCRFFSGSPIKVLATHGAVGGAPKEVSSYISDPFYAADIEAQEVVSMLTIQTTVNGFLKQFGAAGVSLKDYRPQSFEKNQNQTKVNEKYEHKKFGEI